MQLVLGPVCNHQFSCGEESALDEIISDDVLGFDGEIEIDQDDDGKVANWKLVCMVNMNTGCMPTQGRVSHCVPIVVVFQTS